MKWRTGDKPNWKEESPSLLKELWMSFICLGVALQIWNLIEDVSLRAQHTLPSTIVSCKEHCILISRFSKEKGVDSELLIWFVMYSDLVPFIELQTTNKCIQINVHLREVPRRIKNIFQLKYNFSIIMFIAFRRPSTHGYNELPRRAQSTFVHLN